MSEEIDPMIDDLNKQISTFVNCIGGDRKQQLGKMMAQDHRTLVQQKMEIFLAFCHELKYQYDNGHFDARNEDACKIANEVASKYPKTLPYV